ncbi:hypothetical protein T12_7329 [Trichinella patagoniensis]|uniref:Uncharacterized protein n=1 Tax=Trichinella patagoniensis TaxID=990121 RepID=A0A0V0YTL8_9BILA|nr:hypothetical protein T12_7329 [Trichinella patagoniensis]
MLSTELKRKTKKENKFDDQLVIFVPALTPFVDVDRRLLSQTNDAHMLTSNNAMSTAE